MGFLATVRDTQVEESQLDDIWIIREFLMSFSKDLPGLPPDREVEFAIVLAYRTFFFSKTS